MKVRLTHMELIWGQERLVYLEESWCLAAEGLGLWQDSERRQGN